MSAPEIRLFPDPILRRKAEKVKVFDKSVLETVRLMERVMRSQPSGIGIAAPQIGIPARIAIVDVSCRVSGAGRLVLVNPEIREYREERASREGCMSLPDYTARIKRYDKVRLDWQDETGQTHTKTSTGIEAVCIQHEVDHLNGILFLDRVISLKRDMIPRIEVCNIKTVLG